MPTYTYKCKSCEHKFGVEQSITEDPLTTCPKCEEAIFRVIGKNIGVQFVGSGFYINDNNKSSTSSTSTSE